MKTIDWNNVKAASGGFEKLPAGGYVCGITAVEDFESKEFLKFEFDIADGENKNYYRKIYEQNGKWVASFVKSYKDKALGYFKQMLECFEASNKGFEINSNDENRFKRKLIGLVLGYEEYETTDKNGNPVVREKLIVDRILPVADIKAGKFEIPELKKLKGSTTAKASTTDKFVETDADEDVPW